MILKKALYGIRGTIAKSMIIISIPPLVITTIILYLFINNYSNRLIEASLQKSVNYVEIVNEITSDDAKLIHLLENTSVSGGGFFFVIDENGTYIVHPSKKGETDAAMLAVMKSNKDFIKYISDGKEYLSYKKYSEPKKIYIAASILKSNSMVLQKSFGALLLVLVIVTPFIIFMISAFIARYIKTPMRNIIDVANLVSQGDLSKFIIQTHYVKCRDIKNCTKKDCPAFSTPNLACWAIDNTICHEGMEGLWKDEKVQRFCSKCEVYQKCIRGEFDELIEAINNMIVTTQHVVISIKEVSAELNIEADMLAETSSNLEGEMLNQAGYIEETTSSNEELAASIDSISSTARNQADRMTDSMKAMERLSDTSAKVSEKATDVSHKTQAAVKNANETKSILDSTTSKINQISENSRKIVEIIRIINDISEQINLLSLNASIEAARAGEHGRGFAVVAEEISKLADATASSTKEIEKMIQQTGNDVNEGAKLVNTTNNAITQMIENIRLTAVFIEEIAASSLEQREKNRSVLGDIENINEMANIIASTTEEQKISSNEILKALSNINESIQVITNSSANLHKSAEDMKKRSDKLSKVTDYFNVEKKKK